MSYIIKNTNPFVSIKLTEKGREQLALFWFRVYLLVNKNMSKKLTNETFIEKAKLIHNNKYDYSLVDYKNNKTKIKITCPTHDIFEQEPNSHLRGYGCLKCSGVNKTTESFIKESVNLHNNKYDYSLVDYKNNKTKVKIICSVHGTFEQEPNSHLKGHGCLKCSGRQLNTEEYINKVKEKHGNKYDYSLVNYKGSFKKIKIICPIHGEFEQSSDKHIKGHGCLLCKESKGEREIRVILEDYKIKHIQQYVFSGCRDKYPLPFDFYLPELDICIEYDGRQHFEIIDRWGGVNGLIDQEKKDNIKNKFCLENKIKLIRISYKEKIKNKLKENLCHI